MRSFQIGRLFGIPIKLDLTFLLVLPVFAWLIGTQVGLWAGTLNSLWGTAIDPANLDGTQMPWILGAVSAVGLFIGVVLHELGHSLVSMRFGFPIASIKLWLLGGVAQLTEMPENWKQELLIAIAGPIVSIAQGIIFYLILVAVPGFSDPVKFVIGYLALTNFALAAFNLLPGFPMDGGRVLRALLARNRPYAQATRIAAEVGKAFAIFLALIGLFGGGGIFMVAIAFFIYIGASSESQQMTMKAAFEGVRVSDIMTPKDQVDSVSPDNSVTELLRRMFEERHTGYPVMRNTDLVGMVTLSDAREVKEVERDAYTVSDVMSDELHTIPPESNALDALQQMQQHGIGRLLVVDEMGTFHGLISRTDLMTAFDIIQSSGPTQVRPGKTAVEPPSQMFDDPSQ
ncbi:CBS domain-containing protein [Haladaptatus sp. ZSTT2]|uniref:CBS domain-containing protein n=1 Tax=Haladaptatus sp. ZSTT2 TaxID=3120515 RepID=UPI00300F62D7